MRHSIGHIATEQEYFHRLDAERIEEMRSCAALEEQRRRMAEASGVDDPKILEALENLGYKPDTVVLYSLAPLVEVAWADGGPTSAARKRIMVIAGSRSVTENTPAYQQLMAWLDQRPSEAFFEGSLRVVRAVLNSLAPPERDAGRNGILRACWDVAYTFPEPFGWRVRLSAARRKLLEELETLLAPEVLVAAPTAAERPVVPSA